MRRRPGGSGGIFFFPFIIPIILIFAFPSLLKLALIMVALGIGALLLVGILSGKKNPGATPKQTTSIHKNDTTSSVRKTSNNLVKIDAKLNNYFKTNHSLPVVDNISLVTQKGVYITVDDMFLAYKGEKIVQVGEFKESYPDIYEKIMSLLNAFSKLNVEVMKEEVDTTKVKPSAKLSTAEKYIDEINKLNDAIPNVEISNGLYQTCDYLKQIDIVNKEEGKGEDKLTKLYDYYLPILVGILENYKKLNDSKVKTDEFKKCEIQLIKTITLINEALKSIHGSLHESDYMNLNADITTLQDLLKKDGLVDDSPFGKTGEDDE